MSTTRESLVSPTRKAAWRELGTGPKGSACLSVVLEHLADEDGSLAYGRGYSDESVVRRVAIRADDRGDKPESDERKDVRQAG